MWYNIIIEILKKHMPDFLDVVDELEEDNDFFDVRQEDGEIFIV